MSKNQESDSKASHYMVVFLQNSITEDTIGTENESLLPSSRPRGAVEYKRS